MSDNNLNPQVIEETLKKVISTEFNETKKTLESAIDEKFQKTVKEMGLDKLNLKHGIFPVAGGDDETLSRKQRHAAFIKSVFKRDAQFISKAMSEGQDSTGGFLVPEEFHNEVLRIANDYGLVFKLARKLPMKRDNLQIPAESTSVTAYWTNEAAAGTASNPTLSRPELKAKDLTGLSVMSNQLLEDADVDIVNYLMEIFAEEFAGQVDNQAFNGTGSPFMGIFQDSNVNVVTMATGQDTFVETKLGDLRDLISQVKTSALKGAAYFMHRSVWGTMQKIQENSQTIAAIQDNPINVAVDPNNISALMPVGSLWGYPVYTSDKIVSTTAVSTKFVAFGSLAKALVWGDRQQTKMEISNQASVGGVSMFETNQSAVKLHQRLGLQLVLPTAMAVLKTAAS